jgi:hypothetical protein
MEFNEAIIKKIVEQLNMDLQLMWVNRTINYDYKIVDNNVKIFRRLLFYLFGEAIIDESIIITLELSRLKYEYINNYINYIKRI